MARHICRSVFGLLCNPKFSELSSPRPVAALVQSSSSSAGIFGARDPRSTPFANSSSAASLLSFASRSSRAVPFLCGRGDKKTKKGKRFIGKFGNSRPDRGHRIRRIRERWELPPGTPWPVPGLSVEDYRPII